MIIKTIRLLLIEDYYIDNKFQSKDNSINGVKYRSYRRIQNEIQKPPETWNPFWKMQQLYLGLACKTPYFYMSGKHAPEKFKL